MPRIVAGEAAKRATTVASAIRITQPVHARKAVEAIDASGGAVVTVTDEEIVAAWREFAQEGLFCEPASAAGYAALRHVELEPGGRVVCVLTGHGLKDPQWALRNADGSQVEPLVVDAATSEVASALDLTRVAG